MPRFAVVTPTIPGRERMLHAAIASIAAQSFQDLVHLVVGDGPAPEAAGLCAMLGVQFQQVDKEGKWGFNCRNHGIRSVEADYYVFLDDDNLLFRDALADLDRVAKAKGDPPLLAQRIHYYRRWDKRWEVLPSAWPPAFAKWDQLNACVRKDVARACPFRGEYEQDFYFVQDCMTCCGSEPVLLDEISGVHL